MKDPSRKKRTKDQLLKVTCSLSDRPAWLAESETPMPIFNPVNTEPFHPRFEAEESRPRLKIDEGRKRLRIDGAWYDYRGDNTTTFLTMLIKAQGRWESGNNLLKVSAARSVTGTFPRADRILKKLREEIRDIIESRRGGPDGGYRIKPEYFELT